MSRDTRFLAMPEKDSSEWNARGEDSGIVEVCVGDIGAVLVSMVSSAVFVRGR